MAYNEYIVIIGRDFIIINQNTYIVQHYGKLCIQRNGLEGTGHSIILVRILIVILNQLNRRQNPLSQAHRQMKSLIRILPVIEEVQHHKIRYVYVR